MRDQPLLLGLDVGTQSLRAVLVDASGETLGLGVSPIATAHPRPAWAEQDPDEWWKAAGIAVRQALKQADIRPEQVSGIGLDCTACTVVACDVDGRPLRPALLWMDQRAHREAEEISAIRAPVLRYVSGRVSPE